MPSLPVNLGLPTLPFEDDDPQALDVMGNLVTYAAGQMNPPVGAAVLWPGNEVSWDVPPNGLVYVRLISQVPHGDPRCWDQFSSANVALGCLRCVGTMTQDGSAPPWAERTEDAVQIIRDAQSLLLAAKEMPSQFSVINPNWVSLGPQGGVAGGEWTLPFSVTA